VEEEQKTELEDCHVFEGSDALTVEQVMGFELTELPGTGKTLL
jgi:hypothetical protein